MQNVTSELVRVSAAGAEPLVLSDVKLWLSVDFDDDDALISACMSGARRYAERFCRRTFTLGEQWKLSLDHFPMAYLRNEGWWDGSLLGYLTPDLYLLQRPSALAITLENGPVSAVNTVTYLDPTGSQRMLDSSAYTLIPDGDANALLFPSLQVGSAGGSAYISQWPQTQNYPQAVQILYTTGATPEPDVMIALKQIVAHWYKNREAFTSSSGDTQQVPLAAEMLLWPSRLYEF